jgi:hypothetical protein
MRRFFISLAVMAFPLSVSAAPIPFDFTTLNGGAEGILPNSVTVAGVLAEGFLTNFTAEPLWLRNGGTDHGLGVCSEGNSNCTSGGGDVNELDNLDQSEAIRLTLPTGAAQWTSLWVSSLDNGGSNNNESGILEWSNTPTGFTPANTFHFSFNTFNPSIEEDIVAAALAGGFDPTSKYLLFIADSTNCQSANCNNDYVVWKGAYEQPPRLLVPEPGTVALLGAALTVLMFRRRKSA